MLDSRLWLMKMMREAERLFIPFSDIKTHYFHMLLDPDIFTPPHDLEHTALYSSELKE